MKSTQTQVMALVYIFLLMSSPFAVAEDISSAGGAASSTSDQYYDQFSKDSGLWTAANFEKLSPANQAEFLSNNYLAALALEFYKNQNNVGLNSEVDFKYFADLNNLGKNPLADDKFYSSSYASAVSTTLRDFLQLGPGQKEAAAQYFTQKFAATYTFNDIGSDFQYNAQEGTLINGKKTISLNEFKGDTSVQNIVAIANGFKIIRKQEQGVQEVSVQGDGERKIQYDQKNGNLVFKDAQGKEQKFDLAPGKTVNFKFQVDGTLEIAGPVSGIVNLNNEHQFAQFRNREGTLIIHNNGNIEARNALLETAKVYLDGRFEFHKEENRVDAYDVMSNDQKTIIVDKDSRAGAKTQGQNKGESTLKVYLSKISDQSDYSPKSAITSSSQSTVKEVIDNLQKVRPPQGNLNDNAEVYIKKSDDTGKTIVTAKGKVDLGFYDLVTGSVSLSEKEPHFVGINGVSEFDYLGAPQKQINVRGQAVYSDDQYSRIDTKQNGASLKIIRNELDDVIHSGCFNCQAGATALSIGKLVATATATGDTFSEPRFKTVSISATVTKEGLEYNWNSFLNNLGDLAQAKTEGQEIILGKNMLMKNVVCEGSKQCNLMLARDQQAGTTTSFYEVYDPASNQVSKRVAIPTNIGTTLGKATLLTSSENAEKLQKIQVLIQQHRFGEVSSLLQNQPFTEDPALRAHLLKTVGIDINQLDQPQYTQKLSAMVKSYNDAQEKIQSLRQDYGINLDEHGFPVSAEDQQKINDILNKKRIGKELAVFDLYTGARVDLARSEQQQLEATHQSCAGTASCAVSDEDVKQANQKLVSEVLRREKSPEGVEWKQNFILEQEREKQAEEQAKETELLKDKLADAQKLGKKRDDAESDLTRNKAVLGKTIQDIKDQEAKIAPLRAELQKSQEFHLSGRDFFSVLGDIETETEIIRRSVYNAEKELQILDQQKSNLENRIEKNNKALQKINNDLSGLTQDFKQPTSKLALLSAYGDDETVGKMITNSDLPQDKKLELLQTYLGPTVADKIRDLSVSKRFSGENVGQTEKQIDDLLGSGKNALRQAQNYAQYYGDIAGSKVVLDHIAAARPDLVDTPEWRAAKDSYDKAVDNRVTELKEIAQQNLRDKMKQRDGEESGVFSHHDNIGDIVLDYGGKGLTKLGAGIRYTSMKVVAGTLAVGGVLSSVGGEASLGDSLLDAASALHNYDSAKEKQAKAEISALRQEIKSYDKLHELIADARQRGDETATSAKIQEAFKLQAPIVNLGKQMQSKELTVDDHAQEALYNTEQHALVAGGDELVKNEYRAIAAEYWGKSAVANTANDKVLDAEKTAEGSFLTKEDLALYGDPIIDVTVDVSNLIPGVAFAKAGKIAAKVAEVTKITKAFAHTGKAFEVVKDAGKLLAVSNEARLSLQAAKAELQAAQITKGLTVAERTAEIARAEQKVTLAAQTAEAEYRASKAGKASAFLSTPISSDLRAIEKLRLAAQDDQFKAAQKLQEATAAQEAGVGTYRTSPAEGIRTAQEAYQTAAQKINDLDKAKQAYSTAGSDLGTLFEGTALGKQRAVGPGAEKAQQALDDFQKAKEAYHTEKTVFGADKVSQATIDNVITTAKAAEKASFENRVSDAVRGAIGAQRVERNVEQLKAAEIALSFTKEGKLVAEGVQEGSEEAKLVESTNKLLEDQRVVQRIVGDDASRLAKAENVPAAPRKLSAQEFNELEAIDKELEARGATYKINDQDTPEINIDDIVTKDAKDLEDLKLKAQRAEQLFDQADKEALAKQLQARRKAEAVLADNDLQQVARDVKKDLAAKAKGEVDTGIIPEVAGEKAAELPKPLAKTEARIAAADDLPRPRAIEEAIDSRSAGTVSILNPVQEKEVRGLAKIAESTTADENAQKILSAMPEAGGEVKLQTINGNVYQGKVVVKNDNVIVLEQAGKRQRITTGKVADVEVIETPKVRGVSENVNPCNLAAAAIYGLAPCLRDDATRPGQEIVATARDLPSIETAVDLPTFSGEDDWNDIVTIIENNYNGRLSESTLEKLVNKKELYIGGGGEGVVLDVPETVRVQLPGVERPSVIKIKNTHPNLEDIANSFPEQQKILNRLAERGAAPHVYEAGDNFYIAEKVEGSSLKETILDHLTPETRAEYNAAYAKYDEARKLAVENPILVKETKKDIESVLRRAGYQGELDEVQDAVQKLANSLIAENVEVADFHWENVMVVTTPEGKLQAELLDAGFAIPGDPATIERTYNKKLDELMTGGGFAVNPTEIKSAKSERSFAGVSDVVEPCALAGGAIVGLAPCSISSTAQTLDRETIDSKTLPKESVTTIENLPPQKRDITIPRSGDPKFDSIIEVLETHNGKTLTQSDLQKLQAAEDYKLAEGSENIVYDVPNSVLKKINEQRLAEGKAQIEGSVVLKVKKNDFGNNADWLQKIHDDLCVAGVAACLHDISPDGTFQIVSKAKGPELEELVQSALNELEQQKLDSINDAFLEAKAKIGASAEESKSVIQQKATKEGRELSERDKLDLLVIEGNKNSKIQNAYRSSIQDRQNVLQKVYESGRFDKITYGGRTLNLEQEVKQLFAKIREANVEVLDAHYRNIKCVDPECSALVFVDLGTALDSKYSQIKEAGVAERYAKDALTGGNFDIGYEIDRLRKQNLEPVEFQSTLSGVSEVKPCAVAGGAIVGMAPCLANVPAVIESPSTLDELQEGQHISVTASDGKRYSGKLIGRSKFKHEDLISESLVIETIESRGVFGFGYKSDQEFLDVNKLNPHTLVIQGQPVEVRSVHGDIYVGKYIDEDEKVIKIVDESGKTNTLSKTKELNLDSFRKVEVPEQKSQAIRSGKNYVLNDNKYVYDPIDNQWKQKGFFTDKPFAKMNEFISPEKLEDIIQLEAARMNAPVPLVQESMTGRFESLAESVYVSGSPQLFVDPDHYEKSIYDLVQKAENADSLTKENIKDLVLHRARAEVQAGTMTSGQFIALEQDFNKLYERSKTATKDVAAFSEILLQQKPGFTNVHLFRDGAVLGASDELAQKLSGVTNPDIQILYVSRDTTFRQSEKVRDLMFAAAHESDSFLEFRQKFQQKFNFLVRTDSDFRSEVADVLNYMQKENLLKTGAKLRFIDTCCSGSINYLLEGAVRYYRPDIEVESLLMQSNINYFSDGTLSAGLNGDSVEGLVKPTKFAGTYDSTTGAPLMTPVKSGAIIGDEKNYITNFYGENAEQVLSYLDQLAVMEQTAQRIKGTAPIAAVAGN